MPDKKPGLLDDISKVPSWVWLGGAAGIGLLLVLRHGSSSTTSSLPASTSPTDATGTSGATGATAGSVDYGQAIGALANQEQQDISGLQQTMLANQAANAQALAQQQQNYQTALQQQQQAFNTLFGQDQAQIAGLQQSLNNQNTAIQNLLQQVLNTQKGLGNPTPGAGAPVAVTPPASVQPTVPAAPVAIPDTGKPGTPTAPAIVPPVSYTPAPVTQKPDNTPAPKPVPPPPATGSKPVPGGTDKPKPPAPTGAANSGTTGNYQQRPV